ncbi:MAG: LmbE family N-acetylglucosaminyl deacetylase [bacterium]
MRISYNKSMKKTTSVFFTLLVSISFLFAQQPDKPTTSEIFHNLQKLNFLGSAMYIAAHPDDENTRIISFLSNDIHARTAYLSMTRGDGGQNLVGPEIRELLGVIRTQELIAARKTDGGQQFFTRANDFGYSKHPDETLEIWNKEEVLKDVVLNIRRFQPDIIINRFNHRNPGSTHGHHTSSAMLSFEAFDLVGDANKYPESAEKYGTWKPKRLLFNTSWWFYGSKEKFEKADKSKLVEVETGNYYSDLGLSNGEIAALSRSMHKSQGFGNTGSRGSQTEYLEFLKGDFPDNKANLFDGIDTTWSRIEGGKEIGDILYRIEENFNFKDPSLMVPELLEAYQLLLNHKQGHWKTVKLEEIKQLIADCAGLYMEAVADQQNAVKNGEVKVTIEAINRSNLKIELGSVNSMFISFPNSLKPYQLEKNQKTVIESVEGTFNYQNYSTPYWLNEKGTIGMYRVDDKNNIGLPEKAMDFPITFQLTINGKNLSYKRNLVYKYNDPVKGEVYQPFDVLPQATASIKEKVIIFSDNNPKQIPVTVKAGRDNLDGTVSLQSPKGWAISPASQSFSVSKKGDDATLLFMVTPPNNQSEGKLKPIVKIGNQSHQKELFTIDYDYIPLQQVLMDAEAKVVHISIEKKGQNIGYIKGAGDAIPESLEQIGYQVTSINPSEITSENLNQFDAIVVGIRAYNTVPELAFKQPELNSYVENGGTLLLQYNTSHRLVTKEIAPYQLELSRDRVTDEFSEVILLAPDHQVLNYPNKITKTDFENWVQERGLYFPNKWGKEFIPILGMNDKGSKKTKGSLLVASYGKGYYIYTGISFFRELPAGVSGAYRLFANLLSIGK